MFSFECFVDQVNLKSGFLSSLFNIKVMQTTKGLKEHPSCLPVS